MYLHPLNIISLITTKHYYKQYRYFHNFCHLLTNEYRYKTMEKYQMIRLFLLQKHYFQSFCSLSS